MSTTPETRPEATQPAAGTLRPGAVFELMRDLVQLPDTLKLRNIEWGVLFAVTGEHTVAQIGEHFALIPAERDAVFRRLIEAELIVERPVSYGEYLRAAATQRDDEPKSLARFLRAGVTFGPVARAMPGRAVERGAASRQPVAGAARPQTVPSPAVPAPPRSAPDEDPSSLHQTRAIPTFSRAELAAFEPLSAPPQPPQGPQGPQGRASTEPPPSALLVGGAAGGALHGAPPLPAGLPVPGGDGFVPVGEERRLSLKRVMQFILDRAPDLNAGQLDIYRVFIRVNTKLLRRNGITTLRFEEDRLIVDPELQRAITGSVERTLGLTCPQEVFLTP